MQHASNTEKQAGNVSVGHHNLDRPLSCSLHQPGQRQTAAARRSHMINGVYRCHKSKQIIEQFLKTYCCSQQALPSDNNSYIIPQILLQARKLTTK
jgi:hypothetical protein